MLFDNLAANLDASATNRPAELGNGFVSYLQLAYLQHYSRIRL